MTHAPLSSRRPGLAVATLIHALVFATVAVIGPAVPTSWFALTIWPLVALHLALAVLAVLPRERLRAQVWTATALYSLAWLLGLTLVIANSAAYVAEIYGGLGEAIAGALACIWGLVVLFTLPIAAWGLAVVRPGWLWRRKLAVGAVALLAVLTSCSLRSSGALRPVAGAASDELARQLQPLAREHAGTPLGQPPRSVLQRAPFRCAQPPASNLTLLVTTRDLHERSLSVCLQTSDLSGLVAQLAALLRDQASPTAPVKLDLVRATHTIPRLHPLLDALALRPALDGVCSSDRCLAPWQLVASDAFTTNHPMDSMRDASFGVSMPGLASALDTSEDATLMRFETASWVIDQHTLIPLVRGRALEAPFDDAALDRSVAAAGKHILAAERPNGTFRYTLDPFNGRTEERMVSMRRQAGTVFALCDLLPAELVAEPADRALGLLASYEQQHGELRMLGEREDVAEIGPTALPLISFTACRHAVGPKYDALIAGMTRFLLTLQRDNGAFYPEFVFATGKPRGEFESLYAGGQAMLGLVLAEQIVRAHPSPAWPDAQRLHDGIERAMRYYGNDYWPRPLRSLFYLEENWHCLAARAALRSHRNDDYEQLCLDYAHFKTRWILGEDASPEHVGGYSMSDIFPPHAAVTAGYGEVMSASLEIQHARGMDLRPDQATLRTVLGWLMRQQWTAQTCFACGAHGEAIGGFSEHTASPKIRIDYVQHAMAALGHGKQALALR
ncbi:MAG TPA: hypothetical protein VFX59_24460 [Polyangiales bacterium]|nr:hypothetical protein [Polyangiales bacterium]